MAVVSTGQLTIVDNNDARPISAYLTASPGPQQVFSKDESAVAYTPNWNSSPLVITAKALIGGIGSSQDLIPLMNAVNRKFFVNDIEIPSATNALISSNATMDSVFVSASGYTYTVAHSASASTLSIKSNMMETVALINIRFEGDYTDPVTGLTSKVIAQITLNRVTTGTNAVFLQSRGTTSIEESTGQVKNVAVVGVDLIRAAGIDTTGIKYKWFTGNGATVITSATAAGLFGFKTTSIASAMTGTASELGVNLPDANNQTTHNTIVISEAAVADIGIFKVEATDAIGTTYQTYFTIQDQSDPYDTRIISSSGDKLQNGQGTTVLTPQVYYGSSLITNLTGWTFDWEIKQSNGSAAAFIDVSKTAYNSGRDITANTTTGFTYSGATAVGAVLGDLVKVVSASGLVRYYEVNTVTGTSPFQITIKPAGTDSNIEYTAAENPAPIASQFVGGKLYMCHKGGLRTTAGSNTITVTGDDVDGKAVILVTANRPD